MHILVFVLCFIGIVGILDVLFFRGQIGVEMSRVCSNR